MTISHVRPLPLAITVAVPALCATFSTLWALDSGSTKAAGVALALFASTAFNARAWTHTKTDNMQDFAEGLWTTLGEMGPALKAVGGYILQKEEPRSWE